MIHSETVISSFKKKLLCFVYIHVFVSTFSDKIVTLFLKT